MYVLIWLVIVNIFGLVALNRLNLEKDSSYAWIETEMKTYTQNKTWDPVRMHAKWDSFWHMSVASRGYFYLPQEKKSNIVFFPLYPLLVKALSWVTPGDLIVPGWVVSILSLFLAVGYLYKLIKNIFPNIDPKQVVFFLLIFPTAFFLNAVYTESLFLFFSVALFCYLHQKKYFIAGVFGLLAALTRITGVLLFVPFVYEIIQKWNVEKKWNLKYLYALLIPFGTLCVFMYYKMVFGNFWLFFEVQNWFGRAFEINRDHFFPLTEAATSNMILDIGFVFFGLCMGIYTFKKIRASYGIYILISLLVPLSTGTMMSIGRYLLVLFPIYIALASLKNEAIKNTWIFVSLLLFALNITLFVNNYWAG